MAYFFHELLQFVSQFYSLWKVVVYSRKDLKGSLVMKLNPGYLLKSFLLYDLNSLIKSIWLFLQRKSKCSKKCWNKALLLWTLICGKSHASIPEWYDSMETNLRWKCYLNGAVVIGNVRNVVLCSVQTCRTFEKQQRGWVLRK